MSVCVHTNIRLRLVRVISLAYSCIHLKIRYSTSIIIIFCTVPCLETKIHASHSVVVHQNTCSLFRGERKKLFIPMI